MRSIAILLLCLCSYEVNAQDQPTNVTELDPTGYIEPRAYEAFNPTEGIYHAEVGGVTAAIDSGTNRIYLSGSLGTFEMEVTDAFLTQVGISRSTLTEMLTSEASLYQAKYGSSNSSNLTFNRDRDGDGVPDEPCGYFDHRCTPWQTSHFTTNNGLNLQTYIERFGFNGGPDSPTREQKETACRNVTDYSYKGMMEAGGLGACLVLATTPPGWASCAVTLGKLAFTTYQRQKNQRVCQSE